MDENQKQLGNAADAISTKMRLTTIIVCFNN